MKTPTPNARRALTIAAGIALIALPAAAAVQTQGTAPTPAAATVVADAAVSAAPAPAPAGAAAVSAPVAAPGITHTTPENDELASTAPAAGSASPNTALAAPADETGSTEAQTVQRRCDAKDDPHYHPSSGRDVTKCYDANGQFQPGRTYTATHFTNEVECGDKNLLGGAGAIGLWAAGTASTNGGYASVCSDDTLPIHGRATARGGTGGATATIDGDRTNPEQTTQGWITVSATPAGPSHRCGKSYAEGGRANSDAPTGQDTAAECG